MNKFLFVLALALICGANALNMRPVSKVSNVADSPFNGTVSLGTIYPNKWNQTVITLPSSLSNIPLTTIWVFFADTATGKPIPSENFQRASLTISTSNDNLSGYNALTTSLGVPRTFPATSPYVIPQGNLTLKVTYALNAGVAPTNASVTWIFVQGTATANTVEHASIFLPGWKGAGETTGDVTTAIPYDGIITWGVGNVLVGGQSVTVLNNATGAVICTSALTATGDFSPCSLNTQIAKGTKLTVVVKSNSTGIANNGGMDLYIVKIVPVTTTTAATTAAATTHSAATTGATHTTGAATTHSAATAATHAAATTHSAATTGSANSGNSGNSGSGNSGNSGHSGSGNSGSGNSGNSGHSGSGNSGSGNSGSGNSGSGNSGTSGNGNGNSAANGGVTMGYSSGSSGSSGSSSGTGGFFDTEKSIFQMKQKATKDIKPKTSNVVKNSRDVTLNDLKRKAMNLNDEVDETEESADHFRVFEEKSSQKFL